MNMEMDMKMDMKDNWKTFIETAKAQGASHKKVAEQWDKVDNILNLMVIVFSAVTTVVALLKSIPFPVAGVVSGVTTLLSLVVAALRPNRRRQIQSELSKQFSSLMMRMIRCETEKEYTQLCNEYNKKVAGAGKPTKDDDDNISYNTGYNMTFQLTEIIDEKEKLIRR